ncbi:DUF4432 family protein [bacterium]|nr:DUF4432 family protein [bacterium]
MAEQVFVLTDSDASTHLDEFTLDASTEISLAGSSDWSVRVRTLKGGESHGVCVVELCNGPLSLSILPTRGMSVWKGHYRELPLEWKSPVPRPVHPAFVNLHDRNGLGWLNGFNELMVRCGLTFNGPPGNDEGTDVTLHGRIGNLPAHRVTLRIDDTGPGTLTLTGIVDETTMFGPCFRLTSTVKMTAGSNTVEFQDEITNIGGAAAPLSLLYHINIGHPFLDGGGRNVVACRELAPRDPRAAEGVSTHNIYEPPTPGFAEQAYYYKPAVDERGWSTAVLHNAVADAGFAVHYDASQLPWFVVWKNTMSLAEGYVTGLEPAVNLPNFRGYERQQDRLPVIAPGEVYRTAMTWDLADDTAGVARQCRHAQQLQHGRPPVVHPLPHPGWSPSADAK